MTSFGILSLLPVGIALLAIAFFRRVALGLLLGACTSFALLFFAHAPFRSADFLSKERIAIVMFVLLMGCLQAILEKTCALDTFLKFMSNALRTQKQAQFLMSLLVVPSILDELNVGMRASSALRSSFSGLKISREKLSFLVDQTTSIAPSLVGASIFCAFLSSSLSPTLAQAEIEADSLSLLLTSISFHYYAWFSVLIVVIALCSGREFGFMYVAEKKALTRSCKTIDPSPLSPEDFSRLILIGGSLLALFAGGLLVLITSINLHSPAYMAFPVSASLAIFFAIFFSLINNLFDPESLFAACVFGAKNSMPVILIMITAWAMSDGLHSLGTAQFLVTTIFHSVNPLVMPALVFACASATSLIMGISLGTLALLVPLAFPIALMMSHDQGFIMVIIASLMGGSIFGGHCSELFETTVQSAIGSRTDIAAHMRSKIPYAVLAAFLTICTSTAILVWPEAVMWCLPIGFVIIATVFFVFGRSLRSSTLLTVREN